MNIRNKKIIKNLKNLLRFKEKKRLNRINFKNTQ